MESVAAVDGKEEAIAVSERTVPLYSWWKTPGENYTAYAVVEKLGNGASGYYRITQVALLGWMNETPRIRSIEDFWDLVDRGQLIAVEPVWQPVKVKYPDAG
jgi:hypothetical protein